MQETQKRLLDTAINLIWQSNYSAVGVNEICKQAGVTKGSFYHHFDSKARLFKEASDYYWVTLKSDLDEVFSPTCSPLEQLDGLVDYLIYMQETIPGDNNPVTGCPFFTSGAQAGAGDELVRESARIITDKGVHYTKALVRNLEAGGYLEGGRDPEQIGRMLQQYIQGLLLYGRVYESLDVVKEDMRAGVSFLLGLKKEHYADNKKPGKKVA